MPDYTETNLEAYMNDRGGTSYSRAFTPSGLSNWQWDYTTVEEAISPGPSPGLANLRSVAQFESDLFGPAPSPRPAAAAPQAAPAAPASKTAKTAKTTQTAKTTKDATGVGASPESSGGATGGAGTGTDGGVGVSQLFERLLQGDVPLGKRVMAEREKTEVLRERLKRQKMMEETVVGRKLKTLRDRLDLIGIDYDDEMDVGQLQKLLVDHLRAQRALKGPGKPLTREQKKKMRAGTRTVPYVSEEEARRARQREADRARKERGAAYEAARQKERRQKAADVLTGGDMGTLDYIDTENVPAAELKKRLGKKRMDEAIMRGSQQ